MSKCSAAHDRSQNFLSTLALLEQATQSLSGGVHHFAIQCALMTKVWEQRKTESIQSHMKHQVKFALNFLIKPKAIIFGIVLLNFILSLMYVRQVELEIDARVQEGIWPYPAHWNPTAVMQEPFLLLVASLSLLFGRWWSYLLAILSSGQVIYKLGYNSWTAVSNAHGVPMCSWQALEKLWLVIYEPRPQYLFEVALATVVITYSIFLVTKIVHREYRY